MIAGTIILESYVLYFLAYSEGKVTYTVTCTQFGESETCTVLAEHFSAALGIALDPNGEGTKKQWESAELAMSLTNKALRWIP